MARISPGESQNLRFPRPNAEEGKGVFDISKKIISHQSELKMACISPGESPILHLPSDQTRPSWINSGDVGLV